MWHRRGWHSLGTITLETTMQKGMTKEVFEKIDKDMSGFIDTSEFEEFLEARDKERVRRQSNLNKVNVVISSI